MPFNSETGKLAGQKAVNIGLYEHVEQPLFLDIDEEE